jgi:hypothetical protein
LSGDPCTDALTPAQVKAALGVSPAGKRNDSGSLGAYCSWSNPDTSAQIAVAYITSTHVGLSGVYQNTQSSSAVWRVLPPIQGFPAVAHAGNKGTPSPNDYCQVSVGLADDLSIDVTTTLGETKKGKVDPCDIGALTATAAVTTLRQKAGA